MYAQHAGHTVHITAPRIFEFTHKINKLLLIRTDCLINQILSAKPS